MLHDEQIIMHIQRWEVRMAGGWYKGRPMSKNTIKTYMAIGTSFLQQHPNQTIEDVEQFLFAIPTSQFAKREKAHRAIVCLMKHLGKDAAFMSALGAMRPVRFEPPKRAHVTDQDLNKMKNSCTSAIESAILIVSTETGMRVSELASLTWSDVDFNEGYIWIRRGKWMKDARRVGMTPAVKRVLMVIRSNKLSDAVFGCSSRWGIYRIIKNIADRVGVEASPHALRRAFVTINHSKGRPLKVLQIACGHSDIKTTESYCRINETEAAEMMKNWA